jgi:hypothetical protein
MSATQPAFARSGEEMTPPATLADRAKRTVLRKVVDRLRPLAYRRGTGGIRCLTSTTCSTTSASAPTASSGR